MVPGASLDPPGDVDGGGDPPGDVNGGGDPPGDVDVGGDQFFHENRAKEEEKKIIYLVFIWEAFQIGHVKAITSVIFFIIT